MNETVIALSENDDDCVSFEKSCAEHCQKFDVFVPVVVKPFGRADNEHIVVDCVGGPRVLPGHRCREHEHREHEFTIAQVIKVLIPVKFGAEVCVDESCDEDLGSCQEIEPQSITLNHTSLRLDRYQTRQLTATVLPVDAKDKMVLWTSNNTANVTVSSSGLVTAVRRGTAVITAKTVNGLTAYCDVEVRDENV